MTGILSAARLSLTQRHFKDVLSQRLPDWEEEERGSNRSHADEERRDDRREEDGGRRKKKCSFDTQTVIMSQSAC